MARSAERTTSFRHGSPLPALRLATRVADIGEKFIARSRALATDGFIVYDIQDEAGRTAEPRPFPFMKTLDAAEYGALLQRRSGKGAVIYKCVVEADHETFDGWLDDAVSRHDHRCFNLVGGASSSVNYTGPTMPDAAQKVLARSAAFGCVTIAERHAKKGTEHTALLSKSEMGAKWFISQVRAPASANRANARAHRSHAGARACALCTPLPATCRTGAPPTLPTL